MSPEGEKVVKLQFFLREAMSADVTGDVYNSARGGHTAVPGFATERHLIHGFESRAVLFERFKKLEAVYKSIGRKSVVDFRF